MTFNTQTAETSRGHTTSGIVPVLVKLGAKARCVLKTMQIARMQSSLSSMSDTQLAQIGISRSDIPKYAETLMAKE